MPYTQLSPHYTLPPASASTLGGICIGGAFDLNIDNQLTCDKDVLLKGTGNNSIQVGSGGSAANSLDVAIGFNAAATGGVIGQGTAPAIAIGPLATATGPNNIQIGHGTNSDASPSLYVGGNAANHKLLDLSTGLIPSARIPGATVANAGKYLTINSSGEIVAADLPLYNGGVS